MLLGWQDDGNAVTGADGTYNIAEMNTGRYRVCFGDATDGTYAQACYQDAPTVDGATEVAVTVGQTITGINAKLATAGHIAGTVTGTGGSALAGIKVEASVWSASQNGWQMMGSGVTGSDGTYGVGALSAGSYRVCFTDGNTNGYATQCYTDAVTADGAADVAVAAGQTTAGINAQLAPAGHITGTVTDATGRGLLRIQVDARVWDAGTNNWQWVTSVVTGPDGTYNVGALHAGTYRICFSDLNRGAYADECYNNATTVAGGTDVPVVAGQTTAAINAQLALTGGTTLTIDDVSKPEGQSGANAYVFTVTLSRPRAGGVTVKYATANGSALAGSDYTPVSGTLTFDAGETTKTITVNVIGDRQVEANETFVVNLSAPTGGTLSRRQGLGTILNDDWPSLSINSVRKVEGQTGETAYVFTVTLTPAGFVPVTVAYSTADGTARAGSDYRAQSGTLTFAPGQRSKTVTVNVIGDTVVEPDETFFVNLSAPTAATLAAGQGLGTILNDDWPTLRIGEVSQPEGQAGPTPLIFKVTLSTAAFVPVTVNYATANGTATLANGDYTAARGTLTFAPGELTKTITVNATGDTRVEPNETFFVNLSAPIGATLLGPPGVGRILNDD